MKNTKQLFIATALFLTGLMNAQVGIGTITPATSAELEVSSTTKGFLPPRMTRTQMIEITSPALGLTVYCTNCDIKGLYTNQAEGSPLWQIVSNVSGPLDATGNTTASLNTFYNGWVSTDGGLTSSYTGTSTTIDHSPFTTSEKFSNNTTCNGPTVLISRGGTCPTSVVVGNNTYYTTNINGQCWMKTNLKETPSAFPNSNVDYAWLGTTKTVDNGNWGFYNTTEVSGIANFGTTEPAAGEGMLYQWKAAMNGSTTERAQGVCPTGWHIPSDCEFMYLEHGLGMSLASQIITGTRAAGLLVQEGDVGTKLKSSITSGFTALYSGRRDPSYVGGISFVNRGSGPFYWTSTLGNTNLAYYRTITIGGKGVSRSAVSVFGAYSVRCLKN